MKCGPTHHLGCACREAQLAEERRRLEAERDAALRKLARLATMLRKEGCQDCPATMLARRLLNEGAAKDLP